LLFGAEECSLERYVNSASPNDFSEQLRLGLAHQQAGRFADAEAMYRVALALAPTQPEPRRRLGLLARERGDLAEAGRWLKDALAAEPASLLIWSDLGDCQFGAGKYREALAAFRRVIELGPARAEAWHRCGNAHAALANWAEAEACYEQALELRPALAESHYNLGRIAQTRGESAVAERRYKSALRWRPEYPEALLNLGFLQQERGAGSLAAGHYLRALAHRPNYPEALINLGALCHARGQFETGREYLLKAIELAPERADLWTKLGDAFVGENRCREALAAYENALQREPQFAPARYGRGWVELLTSDFGRGWIDFEARWGVEGLSEGESRPPGRPLEDLNQTPGQRVLLYAERGLGDTLQFIRYASLVAAAGAEVVVACHTSLKSLVATVPGVSRVVGRGEPLGDYDLQAPLLSLPRIFGTTEGSIPGRDPYLRPPPSANVRRLGAVAGTVKVGLVWAGNPRHKNDRNRSLSWERLKPLCEVAGVGFYSLQLGAANQGWQGKLPLVDLAEELVDFGGTAALARQLDLIISVDTAEID